MVVAHSTLSTKQSTPPQIGRYYKGWIVVEILQLAGSSWLILADPLKFQSSLFGKSNKGRTKTDLLSLQLILVNNAQHILLKMFILSQAEFGRLHYFHAFYNIVLAIFLTLGLFHFGHFQISIPAMAQLASSVLTVAITFAIWLKWKREVPVDLEEADLIKALKKRKIR